MLDDTGNRTGSRWDWAWRAGGFVQGAAVIAVLAAGGFWAATLDKSGLATPEAGDAVEVETSPAGGFIPAEWSGWTFLIVGSEEEAGLLRTALSEGNNIRYGLGLDIMNEEVLVAASREHAKGLEAALRDGNVILVNLGLTTPGMEDRVVNLVV